MKRTGLYIGITICAVFAVWAYRLSTETRHARAELRVLNQAIAKEQERIEMLRAEWAYLNRPERLRDLVSINFDNLQLMQITAQNYGETAMVAFPSHDEIQEMPMIDPADIEAILADIQTEEDSLL